jgi:hypothetical protein
MLIHYGLWGRRAPIPRFVHLLDSNEKQLLLLHKSVMLPHPVQFLPDVSDCQWHQRSIWAGKCEMCATSSCGRVGA